MDDERRSRDRRPNPRGGSSSGTSIVDRDSPDLEVRHEVYDKDDARAMSPRRSSKEVDLMAQEIRRDLHE